MYKNDPKPIPTAAKVYMIICVIFVLACIIEPKIRERRKEKEKEMAIRLEQERIDQLVRDGKMLLLNYDDNPSTCTSDMERHQKEEQELLARIDSLKRLGEAQLKEQEELQKKLDEENRRKAKEEQRKYLQKAATATYDEGYNDGYECGYDNGNMFQGYKYSFMDEKDLAKYSKEYIRGYRKGYNEGYVDGKEDSDFVWY